MSDLMLSRRAATLGLAATAFAGLARIATADAAAAAPGYGPLLSDPAGLIDLPRGFSCRILSTYGERMDDGWIVPDNADGMGCIPLPGGRPALVRNHELAPGDRARGAFGRSRSADLPSTDATAPIPCPEARQRWPSTTPADASFAASEPGRHDPQLRGRYRAMGQLVDARGDVTRARATACRATMAGSSKFPRLRAAGSIRSH